MRDQPERRVVDALVEWIGPDARREVRLGSGRRVPRVDVAATVGEIVFLFECKADPNRSREAEDQVRRYAELGRSLWPSRRVVGAVVTPRVRGSARSISDLDVLVVD